MDIATAKANLRLMINEIRENTAEIKQNRRVKTDSIEIAISALEKQIPKKPLQATKHQRKSGYKHKCNRCGCAVGYLEKKPFRKRILIEQAAAYCCICGQSIDWSDDN